MSREVNIKVCEVCGKDIYEGGTHGGQRMHYDCAVQEYYDFVEMKMKAPEKIKNFFKNRMSYIRVGTLKPIAEFITKNNGIKYRKRFKRGYYIKFDKLHMRKAFLKRLEKEFDDINFSELHISDIHLREIIGSGEITIPQLVNIIAYFDITCEDVFAR